MIVNKKFRAVLEYDPEGEHILSEALHLPRCLKATL